MRALLLTLTTCLLVLPAHAKYSGGTGEPNDPYQIATAADLIALGETPEDYDKHFLLTADIDLDPNLPGRKVIDKAVIAPDVDPGRDYYQGTGFTGVFDGGRHKLLHLTITGASYLGLFGELASGAAVHDLRIEDVNLTGSGDYIGALAAENRGSITHCYSTGVVNATGKTEDHAYGVGGLVASNFGSVTFSHSTATVIGGVYVGGLVGENWGTVARCYSAGVVRGSGSVGGFVGENMGAVTRCGNWGPVAGDAYVGGLIGENYSGRVSDCCSRGAVSGAWSAGGLIGQNGGTSEDAKAAAVIQCYSAGPVKGQAYLGGLVGSNLAVVTGSFWDTHASGQSASAGGTGKTTVEMQTAGTFLNAGWDFVGETANGTEDIWWILDGKDYPRLWWERVLEDDFGDGRPEPLWLEYEPDASKISVKETGGRLEVYASALADNIDAVYVSNGWRLDVGKDFALRVDFHYSKRNLGDSWVMVALLPSIQMPVSRIITFEAGCMNDEPFYLYEAIDGFWRHEETSYRSPDEGTLYVSYDAARDELYLSHKGYGKANAWRTAAGLLGGTWQGEPIYVAIGGGSDGVVLEPGDAWLDDLIVSSGTLVPSDPGDESNPDSKEAGSQSD